jgi:hypothetical protein
MKGGSSVIRRSFCVGLRLLVLASLTVLGGCGGAARHPIVLENQEDAEDFHNFLASYVTAVDDMLKRTRKGENVSDFSAGMLAFNILTTLSSADGDLRAHFTAGGQDVRDYLKTRFQDHPEDEIATLDRMREEGSWALRSSARYTLEMLTHVPESSDSAYDQKIAREELAESLERLEGTLRETDEAVVRTP